MRKQTILILLVEGDSALRQSLKSLFLRPGIEVVEFCDQAGVLQSFQHKCPDLAIIGSAPDGPCDGLDLARQIRQSDKKVPIILIAAKSSEDLVIAALRAAVTDYFKQPFSSEELAASVNRCLSELLPAEFPRKHEMTASGLDEGLHLVGESRPIQEISVYIPKVATTDCNVLITGETGSGKELVAQLIHKDSPRRQKPFVCINCAAIPDSLLESELFGHEKGAFTGAHAFSEGKLKLANGGTVFFDEIGDMSPYAQAKILRTIESKEVYRLGGRNRIALDFRVIAATNRDLEIMVGADNFRKDLYFRLNVARIHIPPLRERKEDLLPLISYYIEELNWQFGREVEGFSEDALEYLTRYDWPGNVRELRNLLEATFINLPPRRISFMDLPEQFRRRLSVTENLPVDERDRMLSALFSTNWNRSKAAQKLHWSRMTLYRKMKRYQVLKRKNGEEGGSPAVGDKV